MTLVKFRGGNELIDSVKLLEQGGIRQGYTVVDLGCGASGHFVFPAAHMVGITGKVYAVDILKSVLSSIVSRGKLEGVDNVEGIWANLEKPGSTRLPDGSVDLTILVNDLSQISDKEAVVREAARITKSGGTLLVGDWKKTASPLGPPSEWRLDPAYIKGLVKPVGFGLVKEFEAGPYHFGIVFKKN